MPTNDTKVPTDISSGLQELGAQPWEQSTKTRLKRVVDAITGKSDGFTAFSAFGNDFGHLDVVLIELLRRIKNPAAAVALVTESLDMEERLRHLERRARCSWLYPLSLMTCAVTVISFLLYRINNLSLPDDAPLDVTLTSDPRVLPIPIGFIVFGIALVVLWVWYILWALQGRVRWLPSVSWIPISERLVQAIEGARLSYRLSKLYEAQVPSVEAMQLLQSTTQDRHFKKWLDETADFERQGGFRSGQSLFHPWSLLPDMELLKQRDPVAAAFHWKANGEHLESTASDRLEITKVMLPVLTYLISACLIYQGMRYSVRWFGFESIDFSVRGNGFDAGARSEAILIVLPVIVAWIAFVWLRFTMPNSPHQRLLRRVMGFTIVFLAGVSGAIFAYSFVPLIIATPLSLTLFVSMIVMVRVQAASDRRNAMRALNFALHHQLPLEPIAEHLGNTRRNALGSQLLQLALQVRQGTNLVQAFKVARLSMTEVTSSLWNSMESIGFGDRSLLRRSGSWAYLAGLWFSMCSISIGYTYFLLPVLESMLDEFDMSPMLSSLMAKLLVTVHLAAFASIVVYGFFWFIPYLGSALPLYRAFFQRRRANLLSHIAENLRIKRPIQVSELTSSYHTESMLCMLKVALHDGMPLPQALGRSGLVHAGEVTWLETAQQNGRLEEVLECIARQIKLESQLSINRTHDFLWGATYLVAGLTVVVCANSSWGTLLQIIGRLT